MEETISTESPEPATFKVSVAMETYNHEAFIAQAIESVLMQKTDFKFEVVIGEDCSTDGTCQVIERYATRHPDIIRPFYRPKNMGIKPNFVDLLGRCRGKYIALLEGDDYWIDPYKLQKQVDFLESHPEYVLVMSNALQIRENERYAKAYLMANLVHDFDFGTRELMRGIGLPRITLTAIFRNGLVTEFPEIYYQGISGDRRLFLLLSLHGKCRYINQVVGVYRKHAGGATNNRQTFEKRLDVKLESIRQAELWNEYLGNQYMAEVEFVRRAMNFRIWQDAVHNRRWREVLSYAPFVQEEDLGSPIGRYFLRVLRFLNLMTGGLVRRKS